MQLRPPVFHERRRCLDHDHTLLPRPLGLAAPPKHLRRQLGEYLTREPSLLCLTQVGPWGHRAFCLRGLPQSGVGRQEHKETPVRSAFLRPPVKELHLTAVSPGTMQKAVVLRIHVTCHPSVTRNHGIAGFTVTVLTRQA